MKQGTIEQRFTARVAYRDFGGGRPLKSETADTYPKGRACAWEGCPTILNSYNPGPLCLLHGQRMSAVVEAAMPPIAELMAREPEGA